MGFNEFIGKLFGNKATRDMKEIKPWVSGNCQTEQ